ncbi:MAG: sigma-70 family RNA polymerase sigma factor [Gemmatimonadota bacterium]|nr:sigma-70 family RNA polymerase sigma factor [Gemmatimonadota bacterium]MDH4349818.1 sigma-70 family RNA polymerase sigma factor [Gemmatimonadota bacterium]MDH5197996.1 sigma-70 family RNA polymerase sigma factor [Gemmatimonadota bacterium]
MESQTDVTALLQAASRGDRGALDTLVPLIYDQLRRIARRELAKERPGHTLDTTALVHETYLKLVGLERVEFVGRAQFFAFSARLMRQVLVDHAKRKRAQKRGGHRVQVPLDEIVQLPGTHAEELIALDDALQRLETHSERSARVVECRFFAGMSIEETATALDVSPATVKRDWELARAWLNRALMPEGDST